MPPATHVGSREVVGYPTGDNRAQSGSTGKRVAALAVWPGRSGRASLLSYAASRDSWGTTKTHLPLDPGGRAPDWWLLLVLHGAATTNRSTPKPQVRMASRVLNFRPGSLTFGKSIQSCRGWIRNYKKSHLAGVIFMIIIIMITITINNTYRARI